MAYHSDYLLDIGIENCSARSADRTSKIVHEFMQGFIVRSAVEPGEIGKKIIKAWHEAALSGR